jgi:hypothetical protein
MRFPMRDASLAIALTVSAANASAHHSYSMFDTSTSVAGGQRFDLTPPADLPPPPK